VPRLSIVIPSLGGAAEFETTLASVLQNRPADCEVLVVHRGPYDDPYALAGEVRFLQVDEESVAAQMNHAWRCARAAIVHFLRCGLETTEGWAEVALTHFRDPEVAAVVPLVFAQDRQSLVAGGVRWTRGGCRQVVTDLRIAQPGHGRLRSAVLGPTLLAGFYRREVLGALDGFDQRLGDGLADVEMALALRELELRAVCEPSCRLIQVHACAESAPNVGNLAWAEEHLFWRSVPRPVDPVTLGWHALAAAGATLRPVLHGSISQAVRAVAGRLVAACDLRLARRHRQRLAQAAQRLDDVATLRARTQRTLNGVSSAEGQSPTTAQRRAA
jgi:hypothetical protein